MARPLRLHVAGGIYHVMSRGNARQDIFADDRDRRRFLRVLRSVVERANVLCHSYCLMGNHYHMLLETPDANLSVAVRQLNGVYAQSFNRRHDRVGHVFEGRFTSRLIERQTYLLAVSRYIVRNPVRANLAVRPSQWPWSSYRAHIGLAKPPPFLSTDWLLLQFDTSDRSSARRTYRRFVQEGSDDAERIRGKNPILGSEAFVAEFRDALNEAAPLTDIPRNHRFAARPTLRKILGRWSDLRDRNRRICRAHVRYGYTMREIADHLEIHAMTVSRAVRENVGM